MPSLPVWSPSLSVNNPRLDELHITLLELSHELFRILADEPVTDDPIFILLKDIAQCYAQHNALEERILELNHCPTLNEHRKGHELTQFKLQEHLERAKANSTDRQALAAALHEWMEHHLCESDMPVRQFMRGVTGA